MKTLDPALLFSDPAFSLGLSQEPRVEGSKDANGINDNAEEDGDEENVVANIEDVAIGCRKSKRQKVPTKFLLGFSDAIYKGENIVYSAKLSVLLDKIKTTFCLSHESGEIQGKDLYEVVERSSQLLTKVVDVLMFHISSLFISQSSLNQHSSCIIMDTQFVSQFTKLYTKFSKFSKKENFKFPANFVQMIQERPSFADAARFYFPFNLDKQYWVSICVDCSRWSVTVLDCNISLRTDSMMNKEIKPIAVMFSYLLKQMGRQVETRECKAMGIERPRTIPQQNVITDSGVSSVLFIQAHEVSGVDVCKCITPDVLETEVERLLVTLYEEIIGPL